MKELALERLAAKQEFVAPREKEQRKTNPEEVWALWLQYGRERKGYSAIPNTEEWAGKNARLERMKQSLASLWNALSEEEKKMMRERVLMIEQENASWEKPDDVMTAYEKNVARRKEVRSLLAVRDADRYAKNGALDADEFAAIEEADLRWEEERLDAYVDGLLTIDVAKLTPENVAVMECAAFDRISTYHEQLERDHFAWTPSREKLADKIVEKMLTTRGPIFLSGPSGSGKTQLLRAIARRLTGRDPFEAGEENVHDIEPLLGTKALASNGQTYINYGLLGRALTGKENSLQTVQGEGGIFYLDEANGYPPQALRALVKRLAGKKPGDIVSFGSWEGKEETMAKGFRFVMAANLKDTKHKDRNEITSEVVRELTTIPVGYMPKEELQEVAISTLMDDNKRIRRPMEECAVPYKKPEVATQTGITRLIPDLAIGNGGALWKFVNFVARNNAVYSGKEKLPNDHHLDNAILDPGKALKLLVTYRRGAMRKGMSLGAYLDEQIAEWKADPQFTEDDRAALVLLSNEIGDFVGFEEDEENIKGVDDTTRKMMTPHGLPMSNRDVARLSPYVPQLIVPKEQIAPRVDIHDAFLADGTVVHFRAVPGQDAMGNTLTPGKRYVRADDTGVSIVLQYQGVVPAGDRYVFFAEATNGSVVNGKEHGAYREWIPPVAPKKKEQLSSPEQAMERLLGKYFFGVDAAEKTCSLMDGTPLLHISGVERKISRELLAQKLQEPHIAQFVQRLEQDPAEKEKWMLVYIPGTPIPEDLDSIGRIAPISVLSMTNVFDKDARRQTPVQQLVYQGDQSSRLDFFRQNGFANNATPSGWRFIPKTVFAGSTSKTQDEQTAFLAQEAAPLGITRKYHRTNAFERFFALLTNFKINSERLMGNVYDRTDEKTAAGLFAMVGNFDAGGVLVGGGDAGANSYFGASFSV